MENLVQQAFVYYQKGKRSKALTYLRKAIEQDPNNVQAWYGLAVCLEDADQKIYSLNRVLSLQPEHTKAREMLRKLLDQRSPFEQTGAETIERPSLVGAIAKLPEKKKSGNILVVSLVVMAIGLGIVIVSLIGLIVAERNQERSASATATAQYTQCSQQFQDDMLRLLSQFFRQQNIAETTPRLNVSAQIARLEDIRNETWNLSSKSCHPTSHRLLMDYMDKIIASYISFSADNDLEMAGLYLEGLKALVKLDEHVARNFNPGGLVAMFRAKGYYYWELLDDPDWKDGL